MTLKDGITRPFVPVILIISLSPSLQNTVLLLPSGWANVEDMRRQTPPPCVSDLTSWSHVGWGGWTSQQHWTLWASTGHRLLPAERGRQCGWGRLGQIKCDRGKLRITIRVKIIIITQSLILFGFCNPLCIRQSFGSHSRILIHFSYEAAPNFK